MIGILGGGFGLYGYLPAIANLAIFPILLPIKYREHFSNRSELIRFSDQISWINTDEEIIQRSEMLVISRRPKDQFELLDRVLAQPQIKNIIFEKPFAKNPDEAVQMQEKILRSNKRCSIGYIFRYLPWAESLATLLTSGNNLAKEHWCLKWHFMAHHYQESIHNWKRNPIEGGGVLRFYGIHIIALLAEWGYKNIAVSELIVDRQISEQSVWRAVFEGPQLPKFTVEIESAQSTQGFTIINRNSERLIHHDLDPFGGKQTNCLEPSIDHRCKYLQKLLSENRRQVENWPRRLFLATELWKKTEAKTILVDLW